MKYGFMTFSTPRMTLAEIVALAAALGYDGVEPRLACHHCHGIELTTDKSQRKILRAQAERSGVVLACLATPCRFADSRDTAEQVALARQYVDLASDLGCRRIRVFGGDVPAGRSHDDAADGLVRTLRTLADYAAARSVDICVETHDSWCDAAIMAFVMREVNHPSVGVNWDIMHTFRQGRASMEEAFRILKPWIRHVHIHDGINRMDKLRLVPLGKGDFDCRTVLRLLHCNNYAGFISGEWNESMMEREFFNSHLASELAALKRYEAACVEV